MTRICSLILLSSFLYGQLYSQMSISGNTCANKGSSQTYTIAGNWSGQTYMSWSVSGGTISGSSSGTPLPHITVIWSSSFTTGSVSVTTSNPSGNASLNVSAPPALTGGTISNSSQSINYNYTPTALSCSAPTGGSCSPTYTYQWYQSSSSGGTYTAVSSSAGTTTSQNLSFNSTWTLTSTTYYKRYTTETSTNTTAWSNIATVTVYGQLSMGTITPSTVTIAPSTSPGQLTGSLPTGGNGSYTYLWYNSPDGVNWTAISPSVTTQSYTPPGLVHTTYYSRQVSSNGVTVDNPPTTESTVTVTAPTYAVTAPDNATGSPNTNMNWLLTTGYDPSGDILSQTKSFYDNMGKQSQTQDKVFYRLNPTTVYTHVFASEPILDAEGRPVLTTMRAPIDYADFIYIPNFVPAADGTNYSFKNFDRYDPSGTETDKTMTPDAVGGQTTKGTLGWYYGPNNTWEAYAATTNYPYSRYSIYKDGTNNHKRSAGQGEAFVMGSGHEASVYITPVSGELSNYLSVRNNYLTTQVGALPSSMFENAMVTVVKDMNGNEAMSIADRAGKVLMEGRPGTDLTVSNSISIAAIPATYSQQVNTASGTSVTLTGIVGPNNVTIYLVSATGTISSVYSGPYAGVSVYYGTNLGSGSLVIAGDEPFTATYTISGTSYSSTSDPDVGGSIQSFKYFKILADNTSITISGSYTIYDMNTEATTSISGGVLNRGFYKLVANSGVVNASWSVGFTDVSYDFYNYSGGLVASIPPAGVKLLLTNGLGAYPTLASVPYITTYTYDAQGRIISSTNADGGTSNFAYRMDGKIRFSQNALQAGSGAYTYTNYDNMGRAIETGQYDGSGTSWATASTTPSILESTDPVAGGLGNGTKTDVVQTVFDLPDATHGQSGYVQDPANLAGSISTTRRYSTVVNNAPSSTNLISQSWYNYDEEGKVVWQINYIAALGSSGYKTIDYTYDGQSRLIKKVFQKNTAAETFVHYFNYDPATSDLWTVYTNTVDNQSTATLQAKYIYYLHGGIKRIELGTNLQGMDYVYTLQGALKSINNSPGTPGTDPGGDGQSPSTFAPDAYGEVLDYYTNDYNNSRVTGVDYIYGVNGNPSGDSYTGNIKAMTWFSTKPSGTGSNAPTTYTYTYDPKYQFLTSTWGNGLTFPAGSGTATYSSTAFNQEKVSGYDLNGNIQGLQRTTSGGANADVLAYTYKANSDQLSTIVNTGSVNETYNFTYDQIGRETNENSGTTATTKYVRYDRMGRVVMVAHDAGFTQPMASFVYDESGNRIEKLTYNSSYVPILATWYYGDVVYTQTITGGTTYGTLTPVEYAVSGGPKRIGVYYKQSSLYTYELRDHLGNVRAVIASTGSVQTATDYYPYGLMIANYGSGYRYGYQGATAEADGETGWNSFTLRMYNPRFGKWMTVDPKSEFWSPYEGMGNDPVSKTDKDGGCAQCSADAFAVSQGMTADDVYQGPNGTYLVNYTLNGATATMQFFKDIQDMGGYTADYSSGASNLVETTVPKVIGGIADAMVKAKLKYLTTLGEMLKENSEIAEGGDDLGPGLGAIDIAEYAVGLANGKRGNMIDPMLGATTLIINQVNANSNQAMLEHGIIQVQQDHNLFGFLQLLSSIDKTSGGVDLMYTYASDAEVAKISANNQLNVDALKFKLSPGYSGVPLYDDDVKYDNVIFYNAKNYFIFKMN